MKCNWLPRIRGSADLCSSREDEEEDEDSPQEDAMNNHASTRIDGGRRAVRRSNLKKDKGEGLLFRAKLIGSQPVPEARGDRMCQDAMTRLKARLLFLFL
ncbi:hypothetical protein HPB49_020812 [Dermacentor silvarum]|uniref:Uncharacterized protein n=1 Tax=Dermacentor silvarum TaxID=543639 RepID=A0ACB8DL18_DERSI|nr:hypothetical protein HPB49_020812 [Dermacentor silvarum]